MTRITNQSHFKPPNRGPKRATLKPSSSLRTGKIIIYVDSNLHKLHLIIQLYSISSCFVVNLRRISSIANGFKEIW